MDPTPGGSGRDETCLAFFGGAHSSDRGPGRGKQLCTCEGGPGPATGSPPPPRPTQEGLCPQHISSCTDTWVPQSGAICLTPSSRPAHPGSLRAAQCFQRREGREERNLIHSVRWLGPSRGTLAAQAAHGEAGARAGSAPQQHPRTQNQREGFWWGMAAISHLPRYRPSVMGEETLPAVHL